MSYISKIGKGSAASAVVISAAAGAWLAWAPVAGADTRPGEIADLVEQVSPAVVTVIASETHGLQDRLLQLDQGVLGGEAGDITSQVRVDHLRGEDG